MGAGGGAHVAAKEDEGDHGGKGHEGVEEVAEADGDPERDYGKDYKSEDKDERVVACAALSHEVCGAAGAVE